jgi:TusA-related sulfurtransferase
MSSSGDPTELLDLTGEVCPYTFVRTRLTLESMPIGATLRIVIDFEPATRNIPRSAREWGQDVGEPVPHDNGTWTIDITKAAQ